MIHQGGIKSSVRCSVLTELDLPIFSEKIISAIAWIYSEKVNPGVVNSPAVFSYIQDNSLFVIVDVYAESDVNKIIPNVGYISICL